MVNEQQYLRWQAPEYHYTDKTPTWYLWVVVIAVILALFAIWQKNLMFGILVIVGAVVLLGLAKHRPRMLQHTLIEKGIIAFPEGGQEEDGRLYMFNEYAGYAINPNPLHPEYSEILLHPKKRLHTHTILMVPDELADAISDQLNYYLDEFEHEDSLIDVISKRLGL